MDVDTTTMSRKNRNNKALPRRPQFEELEPRILYSADLAPQADAAEVVVVEDAVEEPTETAPSTYSVITEAELEQHQAAAQSEAQTVEPDNTESTITKASNQEKRLELVFVDDGVIDPDRFLNDLEDSETTRYETITLNSSKDSFQQILEAISEFENIDALHFISHGSDAAIKLGNLWVNDGNINDYEDEFRVLGLSLSEEADLLFYGCNIAQSGDGQSLLSNISQWTGADVAASNDLTGHANLGGDWALEYTSGQIESTVAVNTELQNQYKAALANSAPTDLTLTYSGVVSSGQIAGDITATDPDTGDTVAYSLINDAGGMFTIDANTGILIWAGAPSTAAVNTYDIIVRATDGGGLTYDESMRIVTGTSANDSLTGTANDDLIFGLGGASSLDPTNLITNGSFESGSTGWTDVNGAGFDIETNGSHSVTGVSGGFYLDMKAASDWSIIEQSVAGLTNGTTYQLSFDAGLTGTGDGLMHVYWNGALIDTIDPSTNALQAYSYNVVAGSGDGTNTVRFDEDGPDAARTTALDNIQLHEVLPAANTLTGGAGDDYLDGGTGDDTAVFSGNRADYDITYYSGTGELLVVDASGGSPDGTDRLINIENLEFADQTVVITDPSAQFNDPPTIDLDGDDNSGSVNGHFATSWTELLGPVVIADADATVGDVDDANLESITVSLINLLDGTDEVLAADTTGTSIVASYDSAAGVLTLSGSDTLAHYQQVLRTVTYDNTATNPNASTRAITFIADDGKGNSLSYTTGLGIVLENGGTTETPLVAYEPPFSELHDDFYEIKSVQNWGQTFQYSSGNSAYSIYKVGMVLSKYPDAENGQVITISLRDSWNGTIIGSGSIPVEAISTSETWYEFDMGNMVLNDGQTYYLQVDNNNTEGKIYLGVDETGTYASGDLLNHSGSVQSGKDAAFRILQYPNTAPTLDIGQSPALNNIAEDSSAPVGAVGTLVSSLVDYSTPAGQVDNVIDPDDSALLGIAVTAADTSNGSWWYSTDNGSNWFALGAVSDANARLLSAEGNARLYFQPNADYSSTMASALTIRAWDQTSEANGSQADTSTNGGFTPFSTASDNVSLTVTAVNDLPTAANNTVSTNEDTDYTFVAGDFSFSDVDSGDTLNSIKITTLEVVGALKLSGADVTLNQVISRADIDAGNLIFELVADANGAGYDSFGFSVNDGTADSAANYTMTIDITAVNDDPTNAGSLPSDVAVTEDVATTIDLSAINLSDVDAGSSDLTVILSTSTGGELTAAAGTGITVGGSVAALTLTGSLTDLNNYLNDNTKLSYIHGTAHLNGNDADTITVQVNDGGNTGSGGGTNQALGTVNVDISAVNDDPTNSGTVPSDVTVAKNISTAIDLSGLVIADVDASGDNLLVALSTTSTTLVTAAAGTGITITNNATDTVWLEGTVADLNNYLSNPSNISYLHKIPGTSGNNADTLAVWVSDQGNTGASGGAYVSFGFISVDIIDTNNAPVITSDGGGATASLNAAENQTSVTTLTSTDTDLDTVTYSISGGADSALFSIDTNSGVLTFDAAPDFETATDFNTDGVYEVEVTADDGNSGTDVQTISVTVTDVNEAPTAASNTVTTNEDTTYTFVASDFGFSDVDAGDTLNSIKITTLETIGALKLSGADVTLNQVISKADIDAGNLTFEPVADANGAGYDSFAFSVNDGALDSLASYTITIVVTAVNDEPSFTTAGNQSVAYESGTHTVPGFASPSAGGDADESGQTFTYSVSNDNNALFSVQPDIDASGQLTYTVANGQTGTATVTVSVTDSGGTAFGGDDTSPGQTFDITIAVNTAPTITPIADQTINEDNNTSALAFTVGDAETAAGSLTVSATSGNQALIPDGNLTLTDLGSGNWTISATPLGDVNGSATITVTVDDGVTTTDETFLVTVNAVNDSPVIATNTGASVAEGSSANVITTAMLNEGDVDDSGAGLTYTIMGNVSNGTLKLNGSAIGLGDTFTQADIDSNLLSYDHDGSQTSFDAFSFGLADGGEDGASGASGVFNFTVTNVNDAPVITSDGGGSTSAINAAENQTSVTTVSSTDDDLDTVTYSITGGVDSALFSIDSNSGVLTFTAARDFETATDSNTDGVYEVEVTANDGNGGTDVQTISVTVTDVNEAPTAANNTVTTNEDTSYTFVAADFGFSDEDSGNTLNSIEVTTLETVGALKLSGADITLNQVISKADIDAGNLTFEPATDDNGSGYDSFGFSVNDGVLDSLASYTMSIDVTAVNDSPTVAVNTGATVAEGSTGNVITTAMLNEGDVDDTGVGLTYTITSDTLNGTLHLSGTAIGLGNTFTQLDIDSGLLTYDHDGSQTSSDSFGFSLTDGNEDGASDALGSFSFTVTNINDAPVITSNGGGNTAFINRPENTLTVTTVTTTDDDSDSISYSIAGGNDATLFAINASTGELQFALAPDYKSPTDSDLDNVYEVVVQADDGNGGVATQSLSIAITDTAENAPGLANHSISLAEDATPQPLYDFNDSGTGNDLDLDGETLSYSLISGNDDGLFAMDTVSGVVSLVNTDVLDYESSSSYILTIEATDGTFTTTAQLTVQIDNVNEAPVISAPGVISVNEDGALGISSISVADPDAATIAVTVTATHGVLALGDQSALSSLPVSDGLDQFTIGGSPSAINQALIGLVFTPNENFNGTATVTVVADDLGNSGIGGALTDIEVISITVIPINDEPLLDVPDQVEILPGEAIEFSTQLNNLEPLQDFDSQSSNHNLSLSIENAQLSINDKSLLGHVTIENDNQLEASGDIATINQILNSLVITPTEGFFGELSLEISLEDEGSVTVGGSRSIHATVNLYVPVPAVPDMDREQSQETVSQPENGNEGNILLIELSETAPTEKKQSGDDSNDASYIPSLVFHMNLGAMGKVVIPNNLLPGEPSNPESGEPAKHSFSSLSVILKKLDWMNRPMDLVFIDGIHFSPAPEGFINTPGSNGDLEDTTLTTQIAEITGAGLVVGSLVWLLKGSSLLSSLLVSYPAWRGMDPLPVLLPKERQKEEAPIEIGGGPKNPRFRLQEHGSRRG